MHLLLLCLSFFCKIPEYVHAQEKIISHLMGWPALIAIIWKWANLLSWLGRDGEIWLASFHIIRNLLAFFQAVLLNGLSCLPAHPAAYNRLHIQLHNQLHFCLFQNAIFYKNVEVRLLKH